MSGNRDSTVNSSITTKLSVAKKLMYLWHTLLYIYDAFNWIENLRVLFFGFTVTSAVKRLPDMSLYLKRFDIKKVNTRFLFKCFVSVTTVIHIILNGILTVKITRRTNNIIILCIKLVMFCFLFLITKDRLTYEYTITNTIL